MDSMQDNQGLTWLGSPIGKPSDQSLFAAPRRISLLTTSFIALVCRVIRYRPLVACPKNYDVDLGIIVLFIPITVKEHDPDRVWIAAQIYARNLVVQWS